jgi:osmoprotectant transport system substrate-binding protein
MPPTRRGYLRRAGSLGGVFATGALGGCTRVGIGEPQQTEVVVGSKPFAEQQILGQLAAQRLQRVDGLLVVDEIGYGNSLDNWTAVRSGLKHLYWEYTGTAWLQLPPQRDERITDPARLYDRVEADAREQGIRMGPPASLSNGFLLVADREWSDATGVTTISDLAARINEGETEFGTAVGESFYHRPDAWRNLTDHYDIDEASRTALEAEDFIVTSIGLTYELLRDGRVQVASGFETDPQLDRPSIVPLEDDRDYFLPYQPAPTAHGPTAEANPELIEALAPVVSALDRPTIRGLNRQVIIEERSAREVARAFLRRLEGTT